MLKKIIFWDNDGTILGSRDPDDQSVKAKTILPNVEKVMENSLLNFIISGIQVEDENTSKDFDPKMMIDRFTLLMQKIPVVAAAFSPKRHGTECYLVFQNPTAKNGFTVIEVHNEKQYEKYVGKFKKPDIGMFEVILDFIKKYYNETLVLDNLNNNNLKQNIVMIGDMPQDRDAAAAFEIGFIDARAVHQGLFD